MKNLKKIAAITLAMSMMVGSSFSAFATASNPTSSGGKTTGTGEVEGVLNTDVYNVVLPTEPTLPNTDTDYKFILDPEGLIASTSNARYGSNVTFESGSSLFFANSTTAYSSASNAKEITNKSSIPVDVTLTATIKGEGVKINPDPTFANDTSASMYMALTSTASNASPSAAAAETGVAVLTTSIEGAPAGSYMATWSNASSKYEYVLDPNKSPVFKDFPFQLTGASNTNGDWSQLAAVKPTVEVVWAVALQSSNVLVTNGNTDVVIYHGETTAPTQITITPVGNAGSNKSPVVMRNDGTLVVIDATTVTIKASWLSAVKAATAEYGAGTYKVTIGAQDYTFTIN